jgi:hypothetical protein
VANPELVRFLSPRLTGSNQCCRYQGKTAYLYLKIVEFMIQGRPFLYQAHDGTVCHVSEKGVERIDGWPSRHLIVAFIDGDMAGYAPQGFLINSSVKLILAVSPKGAVNQPWVKQGGEELNITTLAVDRWSPRELFLTGLVLVLLLSTLD